MLDRALSFIKDNPFLPNVLALQSRLSITWEESIRRCVELSPYVFSRVEEDFAYICGGQPYGPVQYNVWSFFGGNVEKHVRSILRDFRRYFKLLDKNTHGLSIATAVVPDEYPATVRFALSLGFSLRHRDGGNILMQRGGAFYD